MTERLLIWSCNKRKYMKIISLEDDYYKESLGSKLNSVWYIKIKTYKRYKRSDLSDFVCFTQLEISIERERGLNSAQVKVFLFSNEEILMEKIIDFKGISTSGSNTLSCDIKEITGYDLNLILRFPKTDEETIIEEQTLVSKLKYLAKDFQAMLDTGHLSDVTLKCGADVMQAHKFVLCARSPVFEVMFASNMQESKENTVIVNDVDPFVFRTAINFLYSGQVKIASTAMACDLLYVGEKYQIEQLKEGCIEYLKSVLSHDNAIKILEVSDLYDSCLKSDALRLVKENFDEFQNTREWIELKSKNPTLALEVYSLNESEN